MEDRSRFWPGFLLGILLAAHAVICFDAARRLSPTWDEIVYPAAGLAQWHTRSIDLNLEHAFLSKLISAAPVAFLRPSLPWSNPSWQAKDAYRFGYQFTFHNRVPAPSLILWSRIPMILFSLLTALLLYFWSRSLWGPAGGLLTVCAYTATPILLSRASLALLEMPMYFFVTLSLWLHWRWNMTERPALLYGSGCAMGLSFLCKLPSLPLLPTFLILHVLPRPEHRLADRVQAFMKLVLAAAIVIFIVYVPWKGAWVSFKDTFVNLFLFNRILPYYWHGRTFSQPPALLSWAAWILKAPPALLILGIWGAFRWRLSDRNRAAWNHLVFFSLACFFSIFFFGAAVTTIQFSPAYLGLAGLAGGLALYWQEKKTPIVALAVVLLIVAGIDTFHVHPNYLAYFNVLAGGPRRGYQWLADSDQDWGQALPELAKEMERRGRPGLILCYSGAADPRAWGLQYQDLASPALVTAEYQGKPISLNQKPIYLAVATKTLQSEPVLFGWLVQNLRPEAMVSDCFLIYDVTADPEAFRWMADIYRVTRRPRMAQWAFKRATLLDPAR